MSEEPMPEETDLPFEFHEPPPALTPDTLGAGWPYDKSGLEKSPARVAVGSQRGAWYVREEKGDEL